MKKINVVSNNKMVRSIFDSTGELYVNFWDFLELVEFEIDGRVKNLKEDIIGRLNYDMS